MRSVDYSAMDIDRSVFGAGVFAPLVANYVDYIIDSWQRTILFLDVLRQRGNTHFEQAQKTEPSVLNFDHDLILDGRDLDHPVNYTLVQIKTAPDAPAHPRKRPFIIFDPRAGHGPGIGGMKQHSEIGAALDAGHPCYFVGFRPVPEPGQTIEDVCRAEATFIAKVIDRHPDADGMPCLIGNCQAGWQIALTCAIHPDLGGPLILAGAPLSYWAGIHGKAPMRYSGGMLGGSWLATLASDLGAGQFDGAALVQNFENLNPANTYWTKDYNLYSRIDTEAPRFLDFEKWWGSPILLDGAEIQFIVDELFIGNKLSAGEVVTSDGIRVDLRNIHSPIVVFCSHGDDITPPQQALGWILDLYDSDEAIVAAGQTILYSLHPSVGHLGIFVSGAVATKQHEEFAQNIDFIDALPPGLFEATFVAKDDHSVHPELLATAYAMSFHPRTLADIRALGRNSPDDDQCFATVARVAEINQGLYHTLLQPLVQATTQEWTASWLRQTNGHRLRFALFSDRNPWLALLADTAASVRAHRRAAAPDNPFLTLQALASDQMVAAWDGFRDMRDRWIENAFFAIYGAVPLQAAVGLRAQGSQARRKVGRDVAREQAVAAQMDALRRGFSEGQAPQAIVRALIFVLRAADGIDERSFALLRHVRDRHPEINVLSLAEFKQLVRQQYLLIHLDERHAIETLHTLLEASGMEPAALLDVVWQVASAGGEPSPEVDRRYRHLEALLKGERRKPVTRAPLRSVE
ncbi:MAG: DUF3141 domain-containing protein [Azospirillaceae bacterium]|nr:DUF3141 domain-containing protein [Azospirillaceae bacterium]